MTELESRHFAASHVTEVGTISSAGNHWVGGCEEQGICAIPPEHLLIKRGEVHCTERCGGPEFIQLTKPGVIKQQGSLPPQAPDAQGHEGRGVTSGLSLPEC